MIDLRSDTVTKPCKAMLTAMMNANVGDDVYGEDPSVNELESLAAHMLGKQAAIFACSGTQTNLLALMAHCERGEEYLVGQHAHTYRFEAGGAAVLGSIQPQPLVNQPDGTILHTDIEANIKADDIHLATTKLLCLENTYAGQALPMEYIKQTSELAKQYPLSHHLDGARIFNAAIKRGVEAKQIADHFDSVSVCLSKGLGAPVGSVLCGSKTLIKKARRIRKMLGGGMRQAGSLAAAGIYALENNINRLDEDHDNAHRLAQGLSDIDEINVGYCENQTNMVFVEIKDKAKANIIDDMKDKGILLSGRYNLRLVTHLDISANQIDHTVKQFKNYFYHS